MVTALEMEFEAAQLALSAAPDGAQGVLTWETEPDEEAPYLWGDYMVGGVASFRVALARPLRMGAAETGALAALLAGQLRPYCLAMSGVCAGNPSDVALGDVIVAELAYNYEEGKRTDRGFEPDLRQISLSQPWLRDAQALSAEGLPSYGPPTPQDARFWLLERLYVGANPVRLPARERYFPAGTWKPAVQALEKEGLVVRQGSALGLTDLGRDHVEAALVYDVDPPAQLPFAIKVGPIASGDVVVKDGVTWDVLRQGGVRTVVGLEMEAAAIAVAARSAQVEQWVVIKGVMDHADPKKNDRYKPFAARVSAEVLARFLARRMSARHPPSVPRAAPSAATAAAATPRVAEWRMRNGDKLLEEIGSALSHDLPQFHRLFEVAFAAARSAYGLAALARAQAAEIEAQLAGELAKVRQDIRLKRVEGEQILHAPGESSARLARLWDSGDEYLGEASDGLENGLGVYKIYHITRTTSPAQISEYAGHALRQPNAEDEPPYGPSGVFIWPDGSEFAGDWVLGTPAMGYRECLARDDDLQCEFYLGTLSTKLRRHRTFWVPHGQGIAIDIQSRRITCGEFIEGAFGKYGVQRIGF